MKKIISLIGVALLIVIISVLFNAFSFTNHKQDNRLKILVTIPAEKYLIEQIAGQNVAIHVLVPPGYSPETYEPTPQDIQAISKANVYYIEGLLAYEITNLAKIKEINPNLKIVNISDGIEYLPLVDQDHLTESQRKNPDEIKDPHVWLSPKNLKIQAKNLTKSLIDLMPGNASDLVKNEQLLIEKLSNLDESLKTTLKPLNGKSILVYHPAFGYFCSEYGLTQKHIEIEGREPSIAEVTKIVEEAKKDNIKVIFIQEQLSQTTARSIAKELGGAVVPLDPLAEDIVSNLQKIADILSQELVKE